jgi:hypothetical protein
MNNIEPLLRTAELLLRIRYPDCLPQCHRVWTILDEAIRHPSVTEAERARLTEARDRLLRCLRHCPRCKALVPPGRAGVS